jgi:hypothetical protein
MNPITLGALSKRFGPHASVSRMMELRQTAACADVDLPTSAEDEVSISSALIMGVIGEWVNRSRNMSMMQAVSVIKVLREDIINYSEQLQAALKKGDPFDSTQPVKLPSMVVTVMDDRYVTTGKGQDRWFDMEEQYWMEGQLAAIPVKSLALSLLGMWMELAVQSIGAFAQSSV